ncbi:MAG: hypothetical protein ACTSXT_01440 [Candidatus Helarchaeota archaeon]
MEKKELKLLAEHIRDKVIKQYSLEYISIKIKNIKRGHANYRSRLISIPYWAYYQENIYHFKYYILHELSHFINWDKNKLTRHNQEFKNIEKTLLYNYKMIPIYKRAYIKILMDLEKNILWDECKTLGELSNSLI